MGGESRARGDGRGSAGGPRGVRGGVRGSARGYKGGCGGFTRGENPALRGPPAAPPNRSTLCVTFVTRLGLGLASRPHDVFLSSTHLPCCGPLRRMVHGVSHPTRRRKDQRLVSAPPMQVRHALAYLNSRSRNESSMQGAPWTWGLAVGAHGRVVCLSFSEQHASRGGFAHIFDRDRRAVVACCARNAPRRRIFEF